LKKVVFYGRYSSTNQTEQSIEGQLHVCQKFAKLNDMVIVKEYVDRAISGKTDDRPAFQKMIADSKKKQFEGILVYKLDRFARNSFHAAIYKQKLSDNGVRVISATENISDNPEGRMLEGFLIHINQFYSEELSQKVNRGLAESFSKGYYMKKIPPFGYQIIDRKLVIDEATAPLAKEIFERYNKGQKIVQIADWLNSLGMTNQAGNKWRPMNISTHLHNRTYKGEYYYGQFTEPMEVQAIVTPELFESVQKKLEASAHRSHQKSDYDFLLTGKLICAECGHSVSGSTSHGTNHYYYCRHCKKENRHCIPADYLHEKVFETLSEYLTEDKIEELASAAFAVYEKEQHQDERPALERELKQVEKQLQNAVEAVLNGFASESLKVTMQELESRRDKLRESILESSVPIPKFKKEYFTFLLRHMAEMQDTELLDTVVNHIILKEDDTVIICINLTDETNLPPLEQVLFTVSEREGNRKVNNITFTLGWLYIAA